MGLDVAVPVAVEVGVRVAGGGYGSSVDVGEGSAGVLVVVPVGVDVAGGGYAPGAGVGGGGAGVFVNAAAEAISAILAEATSSPVRSSTALPARATEVGKDVWSGVGAGASAGIATEMQPAIASRTTAKAMPGAKTFRVLKPSPPPQVSSALLPSPFSPFFLLISDRARMSSSLTS